MKVHTEITDDDLDRRFPDPDEDDDNPHWGVIACVIAPDGKRMGAQVAQDDDMTPDQVAEAIARCAMAAAGLHSAAAAAALLRYLPGAPTDPKE